MYALEKDYIRKANVISFHKPKDILGPASNPFFFFRLVLLSMYLTP